MTKLTAVRTSTIPVIALLAVAALQIAYYYPRLPALVASHFDVSGMPNRYEPKATFLVLYVGVLVGLAVVYVVIPRLMLALPVEYINLPNKAYWLAPERREATVAFFMDRFTIFGAVTLALIVLVFQLGFTANLSTQTFPSAMGLWLLGAYGVFAVGWLATLALRFYRV